jgi:alpha-1,4-galacturonosyltransferase
VGPSILCLFLSIQEWFTKFVLQQDTTVNGDNHGEGTVYEENPKPCELEYGSYCLWSMKQKERFTRELKQNIQEHERMLSDTTADADLPPVLVSFN